jgi:hypothetical protein
LVHVITSRFGRRSGRSFLAITSWTCNRSAYVWPTEAPHLEDQNMEARKKPERRQALQEAKQAVRAYAREPSRAYADAVEMAWRKVRQLDSLAQWRQARSTRPVLDRSS